jgi:hypothetical protein
MQHHGNMVIGRFFGWLVLFVASAVLVRDALAWTDTRALSPLSLGGLWSNLNASGLIAARHAIEGFAPWLWSWALGPALAVWALPALAILGFALLWLCRRPKQRRFG